MKYRHLLFDLDGTLTNSGEGIINSVMYSLKCLGITEDNRDSVKRFIGPPLVDSYKNFYGLDEVSAWKAVEYYREYFSKKGIFENSVYDGIPSLLNELKNRGHRLYVATSKPLQYAVRILEKFELKSYFEYVSGPDMDEKNSDKSVIIREVLQTTGADKKSSIMIGDRYYDIRGAAENGISSAGVLYGYGNREELEKAGASYIAEKVNDILFCV